MLVRNLKICLIMFWRIIFYFPEKNKKICLTIRNYFLFYILKNKKYDVFREYILIGCYYFYLFFDDYFKK